MGHTNQTANYNLPQFVGTDKPSWLGDINDAFAAIDTAIAAAASEATTADGKADALTTTVSGHTTQIGTLQNTVTTQGNTLNTVTSLIGNGTPTTTDQTIIGAINELNAKEGNLSDLTTTDKSSLVAAINEAAQGGGGTGGSVSVNYTTSQTWSQILTALASAATLTNVTDKSAINMGEGYYNRILRIYDSTSKSYQLTTTTSSELFSSVISLSAYHLLEARTAATYSRTDASSSNPSANGTITLYY